MINCGGSDGEASIFEYQYDDEHSIGTRKRQRLTHLSPGEKLQRRKLKNRVAAQAARDRKKTYMDDMEILIAELQTENKRLANENKLLRQQQHCPNCNGKTTKPTVASGEGSTSVISTSVKSVSTSKSAVLIPQQKEQMQTLLVLMTITSCSLIYLKNCRYLQDDSDLRESGTTGFDEGFANPRGDTSIAEYIPTVVGPAAELLESHKDSITSDHLYHKNINSSDLPRDSMDMTASDLIGLSVDNKSNIVELTSESDMELTYQQGVASSTAPLSVICDLGSDGNQSPYYSDISSLGSPESTDDLGLEWNDTFTDLFPQLNS